MPGTPCDDGNEETLDDVWTSSCLCAGIPTGIGELAGTASVGLSPNPTTGLAVLTFGEGANTTTTLTLYTAAGAGQLLVGKAGGTNRVYMSTAPGTNSWKQVVTD